MDWASMRAPDQGGFQPRSNEFERRTLAADRDPDRERRESDEYQVVLPGPEIPSKGRLEQTCRQRPQVFDSPAMAGSNQVHGQMQVKECQVKHADPEFGMPEYHEKRRAQQAGEKIVR